MIHIERKKKEGKKRRQGQRQREFILSISSLTNLFFLSFFLLPLFYFSLTVSFK